MNTINLSKNGEGAYRQPFIGFSYKGIHSSELGLVRTSDGSRFNMNLLPPLQDETADVPGMDGAYYFGSRYKPQDFTLQIAFDHMNEDHFLQLKEWFKSDELGQLIFDEAPYKYYMAKVSQPPQLKYIPFMENGQRIYKGEGTLQFIAYYPWAKSRVDSPMYVSQFFDGAETIEYDDFEWYAAALGLTLEKDVPYNTTLTKKTAIASENIGGIVKIPEPLISDLDLTSEYDWEIRFPAFLFNIPGVTSENRLETYIVSDYQFEDECILPLTEAGAILFSFGIDNEYDSLNSEYIHVPCPVGFGDTKVTTNRSTSYSIQTYPYHDCIGKYSHELLYSSKEQGAFIVKKECLPNSDEWYEYKCERIVGVFSVKQMPQVLIANWSNTIVTDATLQLYNYQYSQGYISKRGFIYWADIIPNGLDGINTKKHYPMPYFKILSKENISLHENIQVGTTLKQYNFKINKVNIDSDWKIIFPSWYYLTKNKTIEPKISTDITEIALLSNTDEYIRFSLPKEFYENPNLDELIIYNNGDYRLGNKTGKIDIIDGSFFKINTEISSLNIYTEETQGYSDKLNIFNYAPPQLELIEKTEFI